MQNDTATATSKVKCNSCGAGLKFVPGTNNLACDYCGSLTPITNFSETLSGELDYEHYLNEDNIAAIGRQDFTTVKCTSCGSSTTLNRNVSSDNCAFCGNALIVKNGSSNSIIAPQYVLPFTVTEQQARELARKWAKQLYLSPGSFVKKFTEGNITGVYIPYWTYDCNVVTQYNIRTDLSKGGNTQSGVVRNRFNDILVVATKSLPADYAHALGPWDLNGLKPFSDSYLAGFKTEVYNINLRLGMEQAQDRMEAPIRKSISNNLGHNKFDVVSVNHHITDVTFKHLLLPVWLCSYRYNGTLYHYMINGRTGRVKASYPYSYLKIAGLVLASIIMYYIYAKVV